MTMITGYDNWKLDSPDYDETETPRCDGCDCELDESIADETDFVKIASVMKLMTPNVTVASIASVSAITRNARQTERSELTN